MPPCDFLNASNASEWTVVRPPAGYKPLCVYTGRDDYNMPLEVAVAVTTNSNPSREALGKLHQDRVKKLGYPLVIAAKAPNGVWLFGPNAQAAPTGPYELGQSQRLLEAALVEPNAIAAVNRLAKFRQPNSPTQELGITNSGLFASHHIRENIPHRSDWKPACEKSLPLLAKSGTDLVKALGFKVERSASDALLLSGATPTPRAVAVLLTESEQFDARADKYQVSPVAFGLKLAAQQDVPWLILLRGGQIRLYPAKDGVGVGQRGQSDTFFELDLPLLSDDKAGLLQLIFSAEALAPDGTTSQILTDSARYATDLGARLKNRIYDHVVPDLAKAVAAQLPNLKIAVDADGLQLAYSLTLRLLFRLLFQAYAEDRGLLPYGRNPRYDRNALKTLVTDDLISNENLDFDSESQTLWDDLGQVWRVIDKGDKAWGVPAYNGGLFGTDEELHPEGALLSKIALTNDVMGPVLRHMLVDISEDGVPGPVDFRSLSVREFGTIYEGLLESSLSLADQDLTVDSKGAWVPAKEGDTVEAAAGSVYFHSSSGERKATGSYFTPSIIVDHLLDRALDPALEQHLTKVTEALEKGDEAKAHEIFFDFRVADLAMGSGHFLVAAVDRIETAMRNYLVDHNVPGVTNELIKLESAAKEALGSDFEFSGDIDRAGLLRRQVARRCIYGLDINPLAVELARLALWIHTFVPGLPMSSLDHGLVCANSLTGIGTVEEATELLMPGSSDGQLDSLYSSGIETELSRAKDLLQDAANSSEATPKEVKIGAEIAKRAREEARIAKTLMDVAVALRLGVSSELHVRPIEELKEIGESPEIQNVVAPLNPAHMPYLFPEVFLRDNPGFDVLLGNPPWEIMHVEENVWWGLHLPGYRSLAKKDQIEVLEKFRKSRPDLDKEYKSAIETVDRARRLLMKGPFPGIGSGHIDLYQVFAWRNYHLLRTNGRNGLVLPRMALTGSGLQVWRETVLKNSEFSDVAVCINRNHWMFENVHGQYSVSLVCINKCPSSSVTFSGPFFSAKELNQVGSSRASVDVQEFKSWSKTLAFPLLPSFESMEVLVQMRKSPWFSLADEHWEYQPVQGDLNAATAKSFFDFDVDEVRGRIPVLSGSSINLWNPDFGKPYAYADPAVVRPHLLSKFQTSSGKSTSAYRGMSFESEANLPIDVARIAFRNVTNQTNTRTAIVALVPPHQIATHGVPVLVRRSGTARTDAVLLGIMSSVVFDWYVRRWVELNFTFEILNPMPIPRPKNSSEIGNRVIEISGRLAAVDERYAEWAAEVGVPVGSVTDEDVKNDLIAELDALVALLYGLDESQVSHIFETFHRGWDYKPRLESVLAHYENWKDKA